MGETVESLYRRGAISPKQADKLGILKKTKVERPEEEEFDGKQGRRDQGGNRDRGHESGKSDHIERHQRAARKRDDGLGRPSKGGSVNSTGMPGTDEIDRGSSGKGGKNSKEWPTEKNATASTPMNPRSKTKIPKQGGQYGGGGRDTQ